MGRRTVLWQLMTAGPFTSVPSPAPTPNVNADLVTPGVWGFAITAFVMVAVILLIIDMVRRMRRVNYRAEIRQRLEDEAASATPPKG
ncbi:MAG: hypothetical protein ABIP33_10785 [Pseudolysinimonas sp.]